MQFLSPNLHIHQKFEKIYFSLHKWLKELYLRNNYYTQFRDLVRHIERGIVSQNFLSLKMWRKYFRGRKFRELKKKREILGIYLNEKINDFRMK